MADCQTNAEKLKAEGNAFHQQGKYKQAFGRYSEAIKLDDKNAILYANRAASALAMKKYSGAASDAQKAVELDPSYTKAWARLGKAQLALHRYHDSITAYQRALDRVSKVEALSATEQDIKVQCEAGLLACEEALEDATEKGMDVVGIPATAGDIVRLPWMRAARLQGELRNAGEWRSCVWVIVNATMDFKSGVQRMIAMQRTLPDSLSEDESPLVSISNGLLRDQRIFHVESLDFFEMLAEQFSLEGQIFSGWGKSTVKEVRKQALKRLKESGWVKTRAPLSNAVRNWIIEGFLESTTGNIVHSLDYYRQALEILEWGRALWKDIPKDERSIIFEDSFVRGTKRMYASALVKAYASRKLEADAKAILQEVKKVGEDLVAEVAAAGPPPTYCPGMQDLDPGFISSFWYYAEADGLSCIGYYHMQTGLDMVRTNADKALAREQFTLAAKFYTQSAESFPGDDEKRPYYLKVALEAYWRRGTPLDTTLPLCKRIREALLDTARIWEMWQSTPGTQQFFEDVSLFENGAQEALERGKFKLDRILTPKWLPDAPCLLPDADREVEFLIDRRGACKKRV